MPTPSKTEADDSLQEAFSQLDLFSGKLDSLRKKYNDTARELAAVPAPPPPRSLMIPTPAISFYPPLAASVQVPKASVTTGRYSINNPPDPKTLPPSPLPAVAKKIEPKRTSSGRYYIQIANAKDSTALSAVREQVSKCGRVVDSGRGTASDPEAGWLEVSVRDGDASSFMGQLEGVDVKDRVEKLIKVAPGEGRAQAKQLDLRFVKRNDS
jgi:hypothetical protein